MPARETKPNRPVEFAHPPAVPRLTGRSVAYMVKNIKIANHTIGKDQLNSSKMHLNTQKKQVKELKLLSRRRVNECESKIPHSVFDQIACYSFIRNSNIQFSNLCFQVLSRVFFKLVAPLMLSNQSAIA